MTGTDVAAAHGVWGGGARGLAMGGVVVVVEAVVRPLAETVAPAIAEVMVKATTLAPSAVAEGGSEPVLAVPHTSAATNDLATAAAAAAPHSSAGEGARVSTSASARTFARIRLGVLQRKGR